MLLITSSASAYHIAGGEFTYRWISGSTFQIRLTLFRDCSNPNGSDFDNSLKISIYDKVTNVLADSTILINPVKDSLQLEGTACLQPPQVCLIAGVYTGYINLQPNPNGYYMVWERCCRNSVINNLVMPDAAGMAFYAEIADPALLNSSPSFNSHPAPFICENQLFRYTFAATDPDGDSLVYVLTDPLDGGHTSQSDPNPFSNNSGSPSGPRNPDPAPYSSTIWYPGYGLSNILGTSTPLSIDQHTGEIEVHAETQGIYAMAVEVREFRNGIQIGLIRREIQLTVIFCTGNSVPQIDATYTGVKDIEVYATDTINIDIKVHDADGDSIFVKRSGGIFSDSPFPVIDPPFAVTSITDGADSAEMVFTWNTGCNHAAQGAYSVVIEASDNGCPASLTDIGTLNIKVNPQPLTNKSNLLCIDLVNDSVLSIHRASDTAYVERYFSHFMLYRSVNGSGFQPYKLISDVNPLIITDSAAFNNRNNDYCYVISAINKCNDEGPWSDTVCSVSQINTHVNYIKSVSVSGASEVTLKWKEFNDGPYAVYYIYNLNQDSVPALNTILSNYSSFEWVDEHASPSAARECYFMVNEDECGNVSEPGLVACTIFLQGQSGDFVHRLQWSPYINWAGGVGQYAVMRRAVHSSEGYIQAGQQETDLLYNDYSMPRSHALYSYYISASEGAGGEEATSSSNEIMLEQQPLLFVPNSFTPNNDGRNDVFSAGSTYVSELQLTIYNRWGRQVYSSASVESGWDGTVDGRDAAAGVYFYKVQYKSDAATSFTEETGCITLFR